MFHRFVTTDELAEIIDELENLEHHNASNGPHVVTGRHLEMGGVILALDRARDGALCISQRDGVRFIASGSF